MSQTALVSLRRPPERSTYRRRPPRCRGETREGGHTTRRPRGTHNSSANRESRIARLTLFRTATIHPTPRRHSPSRLPSAVSSGSRPRSLDDGNCLCLPNARVPRSAAHLARSSSCRRRVLNDLLSTSLSVIYRYPVSICRAPRGKMYSPVVLQCSPLPVVCWAPGSLE